MSMNKIGSGLIIFLLLASFSFAHETSSDTYVRVVSADYENRDYTFRCIPDEYHGYVVDWDVYADDSDEEFFFSDLAGNEDFSFTFPSDLYYHIGCLIVEPTTGSLQWRGDIHIDLRTELPGAEVIPLSVDKQTRNLEMYCHYESDHPYTVSWAATRYWGAPDEPTRRYDLNWTGKNINYTYPEHGIDHPRCVIRDQVTNEQIEVGLPIEMYENGSLYIADRFGIDLAGNFAPFDYATWILMFNETVIDGGEVNVNEICYSSLNEMPATCSEVITSDVSGGCRTVVCSGKQVMACQKSGFFEMYNQGGPSSVSICLGETCISNNGFARSPNYPICLEVSEPIVPVCGDGVLNQISETCDDGNIVSGDGCSSACQIEVVEPVCGNGVVELNEQCDDGNVVSGDNCSATCRDEKQYTAQNFIIATTNQSPVAEGITDVIIDNLSLRFTPYRVDGVSLRALETLVPSDFLQTVTLVMYNTTAKIVIDENAPVIDVIFGVDLSLILQSQGIESSAILNSDVPSDLFGFVIEQSVCASSVNEMPLSCSGVISSDEAGGCRTIVCSGKQVLACDKGGYFEMYNQGGPAGVEVCLGEFCMSNQGFIRSDVYPICTHGGLAPVCGDGAVNLGSEQCDDGNVASGDGCSSTCQNEIVVPTPMCGDGLVNQASEQCDDGNVANGDGCSSTCQNEVVASNSSVVLAVAPWFPQGNNVVLVCAADFAATSYDWVFGDGSSWIGSNRADVWHTYTSSGVFEASCTAHGAMSASDSLSVTIA